MRTRHAFVVDSRVPGPNVFLDSDSINEFATSEPHHRWSVGGLFDNIKADIAIQDRAWLGSGHEWAGANYVAWNTEGDLAVQQPPTAQNYAIGHAWPKVNPFVPNGNDRRPRLDGYWEKHGHDYVVVLPSGTTDVPEVRPHDHRHLVEYLPASHPNGKSILIVRARHDPAKSVRYTIRFVTAP